jgi:hypothetical protein
MPYYHILDRSVTLYSVYSATPDKAKDSFLNFYDRYADICVEASECKHKKLLPPELDEWVVYKVSRNNNLCKRCCSAFNNTDYTSVILRKEVLQPRKKTRSKYTFQEKRERKIRKSKEYADDLKDVGILARMIMSWDGSCSFSQQIINRPHDGAPEKPIRKTLEYYEHGSMQMYRRQEQAQRNSKGEVGKKRRRVSHTRGIYPPTARALARRNACGEVA